MEKVGLCPSTPQITSPLPSSLFLIRPPRPTATRRPVDKWIMKRDIRKFSPPIIHRAATDTPKQISLLLLFAVVPPHKNAIFVIRGLASRGCWGVMLLCRANNPMMMTIQGCMIWDFRHGRIFVDEKRLCYEISPAKGFGDAKGKYVMNWVTGKFGSWLKTERGAGGIIESVKIERTNGERVWLGSNTDG